MKFLKHIIQLGKTLFLKSKLENYILCIFAFSNIMFITGKVGGSAWLTVGFLLLIVFLIYIKLKNIMYSFFLVAIYSLQFYTPNKYYLVTVFKPFELSPNYDGYLLSYGLNLKNIFLSIPILFVLKEILNDKINFKKNISLFSVLVCISGIIYFLVSSYSATLYSPYINLSLVWLFHHTMMYFVTFLVFYIYTNKNKVFYLINTAIFSTLFLQSLIGIMEFIKQSWLGLPIESSRYVGAYFGAPDAVQSFIRTTGTFAHSNQYALIMTILLVIFIPEALIKRKLLQISIITFAIIGILLTQSRSGWLSLLTVLLLTYKFYKNELVNIVKLFGVKRINIIILIIILSTFLAVIPRIIKSLNAFNTDSSVPTRIEMIKEASMAFILSPWIGYGVGTNEPVIFKLYPEGYIFNFPAPVHNAYIQMLLESGLIGLVGFALPFIYALRNIVNNISVIKKPRNKKTIYIFYITIAGIFSFGVYYLFQPHEGFREFYYLGIILGYAMIGLSEIKKLKLQK
jgi:O-antigen ligase